MKVEIKQCEVLFLGLPYQQHRRKTHIHVYPSSIKKKILNLLPLNKLMRLLLHKQSIFVFVSCVHRTSLLSLFIIIRWLRTNIFVYKSASQLRQTDGQKMPDLHTVWKLKNKLPVKFCTFVYIWVFMHNIHKQHWRHF